MASLVKSRYIIALFKPPDLFEIIITGLSVCWTLLWSSGHLCRLFLHLGSTQLWITNLQQHCWSFNSVHRPENAWNMMLFSGILLALYHNENLHLEGQCCCGNTIKMGQQKKKKMLLSLERLKTVVSLKKSRVWSQESWIFPEKLRLFLRNPQEMRRNIRSFFTTYQLKKRNPPPWKRRGWYMWHRVMARKKSQRSEIAECVSW